MMEVQKFIREFGWSALTDQLGIKVGWYADGKVAILNYDQINSQKSHPVVIECRSLILDSDANVISRAFDRFFNYGEMPELTKSFDFSTSFVLEKSDGSLIKIYWCQPTSRWEISTRSSPFADVNHVSGVMFRDMVLSTLGFDELQFQGFCANKLDRNNTYIFELIGPSNRHVTRYNKNELVLIGIRSNVPPYTEKFDEATVSEFVDSVRDVTDAIRSPVIFDISTPEEAIEAAKALEDLEEGFVVYHPESGLRTKIKSPMYVAIHHMRDNGTLSPRRVAEVVILGETDEYLNYFPEDVGAFMPMEDRLNKLLNDIVSVYNQFKNIESQKDFALSVTKYKFSGILFKARATNVSPLHVFNNMELNKKVELLLNYD